MLIAYYLIAFYSEEISLMDGKRKMNVVDSK